MENLRSLQHNHWSRVHYAMPVKKILYDSMQYARQVTKAHNQEKGNKPSSGEFLSGFYKTDRLIPVVTLVIYLKFKTKISRRKREESKKIGNNIKTVPVETQKRLSGTVFLTVDCERGLCIRGRSGTDSKRIWNNNFQPLPGRSSTDKGRLCKAGSSADGTSGIKIY